MFNFSKGSLGLTNEEITAAETKTGSKFMEPGVHEVKIVEADFHYKNGSCMSEKDPTWANICVVFENAAKAQKKAWILIPTTKLLYGTSQRPEFAFLKFKQFCISLGLPMEADPKVLTQTMTKYFKDPKKLIGMKAEIEIGYTKPYVKYVAKGEFQLCKASGEPIVNEIFSSKEAAIAKAAELGNIQIQEFSDITKYLAKEVVAPKAKQVVEVPGGSEDDDF